MRFWKVSLVEQKGGNGKPTWFLDGVYDYGEVVPAAVDVQHSNFGHYVPVGWEWSIYILCIPRT